MANRRDISIGSANLEPILDAIVANDLPEIRRLIRKNSALATERIARARLYKSGILHWIYAEDTALHLAAAGHLVGIVEFLLASGADPNAAFNRRESAPLHYACDGHPSNPAWAPAMQVATIRTLAGAGANIHARDRNGATPLHRAVRTRSAAAVQTLLSLGSHGDAPNKSGSTPFHLAVQNTGRGGSGSSEAKAAQQEIIRIFLNSGFSPHLKNEAGKTVLDSAKSPAIRAILTKPLG